MKRLLRRRCRRARRGLAGDTARRLSGLICTRLTGLDEFRAAHTLAWYRAEDGEADVACVAQDLVDRGVPAYLPTARNAHLVFAPDPRTPGVTATITRALLDLPPAPDDLIVFLVPGVAFDTSGGRLGRGGGYYDRTFGRFSEGIRIGIAYELQIMPHVPREGWDVDMDLVVTEARVIVAAPRRTTPRAGKEDLGWT